MLLSTHDTSKRIHGILFTRFKVNSNTSTIFQSRLLAGYFRVPSSSFFWMHEPVGLQRLVQQAEESFFDLVKANEVSLLYILTFVYKW